MKQGGKNMSRPMKDSGVEWLGEIPADWEIIKTKNFYSHRKEIAGELADNYQRLALTLNGVIKRSKDDSIGLQPEAFNSYQVLRENELVFKLIDLANVATSRVGYSPYTGIVSPAYIVLRPYKKDESKFGEYYFLSMWQREIFNHIGDDGVRSSLNAGDLLNLPYIFAPDDEKKRIATFLDGECARIDSVIEKTRASIVEYKKLKQAIITRAVTKGIRPARPMKDSGVEWLGEIPADWEIKKLKYISRFMQTKYSKEDGKLNYIGLENIVSWNGKFIETDSVYDIEQSLICEAGDILFGKLRPYLAKVYLNTNKQCCSGEFAVIRISDSVCRRFFFYQFMSHGFIFMVDRSTYGTKMPRANADFIKNICVVVPPMEEQKEIAQYLDEKTTAIDLLVEKKKQLATELERLKKSLIFEYVTGKKEI